MPRPGHAAHVAKLLEEAAGAPPVTLTVREGGRPITQPDPPRAPEPPPASAAPEVEAPVDDPGEAEPPPPARAPAAQPQGRQGSRVLRSVEIEQRAAAAKRRARAEAGRVAREKREAEQRKEEADARARSVQRAASKLDEQRLELERELEMLRNDPMRFMHEHGMGGAQVADFVRSGANPTSRRMAEMEQRFAQQIQQLTKAWEKKLEKVVEEISDDREESANENFLAYIGADTDRFEALNTIYSPTELLQKAEDLAQKNARLHYGWDGDKLCAELEAQARKDPRWKNINARFQKRTKPAESERTERRASPNAQTPDKGRRQVPREEEPPPRAASEARLREDRTGSRDPSYVRVTPAEKHRRHVERLARSFG